MITAHDQANAKADVCLILEGTYPYIRGGVSTWVHQIVTALPDLNFALFYIGAEKSTTGESRYEVPANVISLSHTYLFDESDSTGTRKKPSPAACKNANRHLRDAATAFIRHSKSEDNQSHLLEALADAAHQSPEDFDTFWEHSDTWDIIRSFYQQHLSDEPFIEVYWSLRFMIRPLWKTASSLTKIPPASVYHSVCTGYAGLLGAMAARKTGSSFLLSEHGIYVRERISELLRIDWSATTTCSNSSDTFRLPAILGSSISRLRQLWIDQFIELGRISYQTADHIVSLFQKNADHQVEFGADARRISIIPNGVAIDQINPLRDERHAARRMQPDRMNVGFLGRIVEIKDVKTLLSAAVIVLDKLPQARFLIMGPCDEDLEYADDCRTLADQLGIASAVTFPGEQTLEQALPVTDLMVLSSVSEGLPFVVLEAFAAEIPLVATDVGSCRELVDGRTDETPPIGPAGKIVPTGAPNTLADAIVKILSSRELQDQLGAAGRRRVELTYAEPEVVEGYRDLYVSLGHKSVDENHINSAEN